MENFKSLGLPQLLMHSLEKMNFTTPTPIQAESIPSALKGRDILGSAQTGTGKTAAFGIPLVARLMTDPNSAAIIMTPTRELATQVMKALREIMGRESGIKTAVLIGGEPMPKQFQQLRNRPRLVVGTPGRINDHLERRSLKLDETNFLVLDETDRMLDMGFTEQIERVVAHLPKSRQTLLFSATFPKNITKIAGKYLNDPVRVSIGSTTSPAKNIKQETLRVEEKDKYQQLVEQLHERQGSIIVFVKTKWNAEKMAKRLRSEDHSADAIHGDLRQNRRDKVIQSFRKRKNRILVATDIAARGLDIPHVEHVINYDLPQCPEDYIHRIGRTARAGAKGSALCLITSADGKKWNAIARLINPDAKPEFKEEKSSGGRNRRNSSGPKKFGKYRKDKQKSSFSEGKPRFERDGEKKPFKKRAESPTRGAHQKSSEEGSSEKSSWVKKKRATHNGDGKPARFEKQNDGNAKPEWKGKKKPSNSKKVKPFRKDGQKKSFGGGQQSLPKKRSSSHSKGGHQSLQRRTS